MFSWVNHPPKGGHVGSKSWTNAQCLCGECVKSLPTELLNQHSLATHCNFVTNILFLYWKKYFPIFHQAIIFKLYMWVLCDVKIPVSALNKIHNTSIWSRWWWYLIILVQSIGKCIALYFIIIWSMIRTWPAFIVCTNEPIHLNDILRIIWIWIRHDEVTFSFHQFELCCLL